VKDRVQRSSRFAGFRKLSGFLHMTQPAYPLLFGRLLGLGLCLVAGCADHCARVRQELMSDRAVPAGERTASQPYRIGFPDVLEVMVEGRPELSGTFDVQANGCIDLGLMGGARVEGRSTQEIEDAIARAGRLRPERVRVGVARYKSQHVYLVGEVRGQQRAVSYQGPETVVELLRRAGGLTPESSPTEITVLRYSDLADDEPEIIRVDLREVLLEGNPRTNVVVQPYDQIRIPENSRSRLAKCMHPWLRRLGKVFLTES
jgi:protein involved in polysaccharide export with SLBB domain